MILSFSRFGKEIKHNNNTLREFIENVINKTEDKELKAFRVTLKQEFENKRNLILYFQNGKLKSHHTTWKEFDYNKVLDFQIGNIYSFKLIEVEDIISIDDDYREDFEKRIYKVSRKPLRFSSRYRDDKYGLKEFEDYDNMQRFIDSEYTDIEDIVKVLCEINLTNNELISSLQSSVNKLNKDVYILKQQMKWLSNNKGL